MDLDKFLSMLVTNKLYVARKENFSNIDNQECSLPLKRLFAIQCVGDNVTTHDISSRSRFCKNLFEEYKESKKLLTSCWSLRETDNYLMWKSYTSGIAVCIKTTIEQFIESIQTNDYQVICGKIEYGGYRSNNIEDLLFSKRPYYSNEEEFRFYFYREGNGYDSDHIFLPISIENMIYEVVLSPFILPTSADYIIRILEDEHKYLKGKIRKSNINSKID